MKEHDFGRQNGIVDWCESLGIELC
jgi:hypothetical protein